VKIISHAALTGQVGSVEFVKGVGHTEDEHMLSYFGERPTEYDVLPEDEPAAEATPAEPPSYDDLTDEQVAEAYALRVPEGNATSRRGQVKVLRAHDAAAAELFQN
jgi:hypothetical protein